jgi:dipeptidyl aminopeptidase/acylaminoacyl peptidase
VHPLDIVDGTVLELSAPALPAYAEWIAELSPFVAREYERSGLHAELERQPLTSIVSRDEYERLERAVHEGRCSQLAYASGGLRVAGHILRPPQADSKRPAILFARGGNRDFGSIGPLALLDLMVLADAGYVVVASQYRGGPGSEGNDHFGGDDLDDLLNLAPIARAQPEVDAANLFLWGVSRGGMMAALALRAGLPVRAVALRAPMVDLADTAASRPDMRALFKELMPDFASDPEAALARRSAIRWPDDLGPPILFLRGREDQRVPVSQSERLADALRVRARDVELVVYKRESHFLLLHRQDYLGAVATWFEHHIAVSHEPKVKVNSAKTMPAE